MSCPAAAYRIRSNVIEIVLPTEFHSDANSIGNCFAATYRLHVGGPRGRWGRRYGPPGPGDGLGWGATMVGLEVFYEVNL